MNLRRTYLNNMPHCTGSWTSYFLRRANIQELTQIVNTHYNDHFTKRSRSRHAPNHSQLQLVSCPSRWQHSSVLSKRCLPGTRQGPAKQASSHSLWETLVARAIAIQVLRVVHLIQTSGDRCFCVHRSKLKCCYIVLDMPVRIASSLIRRVAT